jgi:hypothetical protein
VHYSEYILLFPAAEPFLFFSECVQLRHRQIIRPSFPEK